MAYVIHFFTSEETNEVGCGLKSSKLSTSQLSDFELVRVLKTFVGNEDLPDSTYVLPIIEQWKKPFLATMQKWAVLFPKLNEVISLVSKLYPEPEQHPFINMFFRYNDSTEYPYLIAEFHVKSFPL